MLVTLACITLLGLLPPDHPLRRSACRAASAVALAGALRLPGMAASHRRA